MQNMRNKEVINLFLKQLKLKIQISTIKSSVYQNIAKLFAKNEQQNKTGKPIKTQMLKVKFYLL